MKPVRLSPRAEDDLEEIGDFIARDNPTRAVSFVEELLDACRNIGILPEAYPEQKELMPGIRRAVCNRYLIFYSVLPDEVRIERVLHGARELNADQFGG